MNYTTSPHCSVLTNNFRTSRLTPETRVLVNGLLQFKISSTTRLRTPFRLLQCRKVHD